MNAQVASFYNLVSLAKFKLPEDMFTMEVLDNNQVAITSGKADFTVNGLDADNYPHLPVIDTQNQMKLPVHLLTKLLVKQVLLYRCTKVVQF